MLYISPWLERRFTKDKDPHNLLARPRDAPVRTALGAATLSFYVILFIAGGNDVLASVFKVAPESITNLFRILIFVAPVVAFFVTRSACRSLAADKVHPFGGTVGSRVRRTPTGGYELIDPDEDDKPKVGSVLATAETSPFRPPPPPDPD